MKVINIDMPYDWEGIDSENDNMSTGMSASVAFAVNVIGDSSSPDWFPIIFNIGADGKMVFE